MISELSPVAPVEGRTNPRALSASPEAAPVARSEADTVSISSAALQSSQATPTSLDPERAAEAVSWVMSRLQSQAESINGLKMFLKPENLQSFLVANGEEATQKFIENTKNGLIKMEQSLARWNSHAVAEYGAAGSLPAKQEDGTWSLGSFSLSVKGEGYEVHAESGGGVMMSRNGGPFVSWDVDEAARRRMGMSSASIALQLLATPKPIDYAA